MYFTSIHGTLNHIVVGDRFWLKRIADMGTMPKALNEVPFESFDDLEAERQRLDQVIIDLVSGYGEDYFFTNLSYTDTKGVAMSKPLNLIWGHFFNHQTHHRGQVHSAISQAGFEPPELDLTYFHDEELAQAA